MGGRGDGAVVGEGAQDTQAAGVDHPFTMAFAPRLYEAGLHKWCGKMLMDFTAVHGAQ
ncbi:hypothetical protein GCM10010359_65490 [Streptomyces morookaense]|nr:hypothetical protein GCM10010359_65490 [Streptomyces morookaense]